MKTTSTILIAVVVSALVSFGITSKIMPGAQTASVAPAVLAADAGNDAFGRVMKNNKIRCGYYIWSPFMVKDANTGQFSGLFYDMFTQIAKNLGLEIDWAEEVGLGDFPAALASGRIDAYCTPLAQVGSRARAVDFTDAIGYFPVYAFVRADEHRFDGDISKVNQADIKVSTMDGEMSAILTAQLFPQATPLQLPQNAPSSDLLNNVVTDKADVVLNEYTTVNKFLETNPGTLVQVPGVGPVGVFGGGFVLAQGQEKLRQMFNWSIRELLYTGQIRATYQKYGVTDQTVMVPGKPY